MAVIDIFLITAMMDTRRPQRANPVYEDAPRETVGTRDHLSGRN